jgi:benzaldehyde dehydrogenase (NAD)
MMTGSAAQISHRNDVDEASGRQLLAPILAGNLLFGSSGFYPGSGRTADVTDKATGQTIYTTAIASVDDVGKAARDARQAQVAWSRTPGPARSDILRAFAGLLETHRAELMDWLRRETGSITGKGLFEIDLSIRESLEAATLATRPEGSIISDDGERQSVMMRVPLGVVGIITPWNSPLILAVRGVIPALALGNAVILKPDIQTPVCGGLLIARLLQEAGLPNGVFQVMPGGPETGEALVSSPDVAMISFTGSTTGGRKVGEIAGRMLKRVALELGGNNPFIVADDADVERAAMAGAFGSFFHQGQICFTIGRHLVHHHVFDAYVAALVRRTGALKVGDPSVEDVHLGPMINERQAARAEDILARSVAMGARVLTGGTRSGLFFQPTVVVDVTPEMPLFHEEIFGPIAPVLSIADDDEAVRLANQTDYGLAAAIQSSSADRARAMARQIPAGIIHINDQPIVHEVYGPIGGMGSSGNGARTGLPAWEHEYSQMQWLTRAKTSPDYPF